MKLKPLCYILGLDLGIKSVGWACVLIDEYGHPIGLLDCGVRMFQQAEDPENGESLNKNRREKRGVRRQIDHRQERLWKLRQLLKKQGLLVAENFASEKTIKGELRNLPIDVWQLRVAGLYRKLERQEWAAVLLHLVKHRGYLSQRKYKDMHDAQLLLEKEKLKAGKQKNAAAKADINEKEGVLKGIAYTGELLEKGHNGQQFRTAAELALWFAEKDGRIRNTTKFYRHTFNRLDLQKELRELFQEQRAFGNPFTSEELEKQVDDLLMKQRPALQGDALKKMVGKCTFETSEFKAAKHTYSAERFIWLTKLNNLRIVHDGEERGLSDAERRLLLDEPYKKTKLTYAQVRKILGLPENAIFKGLRYGNDEESKKKAESSALMEMKAYHAIRIALEKAGLQGEWENRIRNPELLDVIGTAFSFYKDDDEIKAELAAFRLPDDVLHALLQSLNFDKFIKLSLTALDKILPLMEQGKRYDEARAEIYGDHHAQKENQNNLLLPPIQADDVRNPVVLRTLTQARKVVNEIIRRYGSPARVHIETARELGKSKKERDKLDQQYKENEAERKRLADDIRQHFGFEPKPKDILKLRLYEHQHGKCLYTNLRQEKGYCLYTGNVIELSRLFEHGYVEIDHALPFSRTWDDSLNNKVLVLKSSNQNKGNKTPYEWLDGASNSPEWREFLARLSGCRFSLKKKQRIQTAKLDRKAEQGFLERNLNDTRYVAKFFVRFVKENLRLAETGTVVHQISGLDENQYWVERRKERVFAPSGQITAQLRGLWGLPKDRELNDRHHALDAIVVACSTVSMQQKITQAMQGREVLETIDTETGEVKTRIPQPWDFFRQEVMLRVFSDNPCEALAEQLSSRPEAVHEFVKPLFVSRAPNRKMTGQGHEETIKSAKRLPENISVVKKILMPVKQTDKGLRLQDIQYIAGYPNREPALYAALMIRLLKFNNEPKKAFVNSFYKPSKRVDEIIHKQLVDAWEEYLRQLTQEIENKEGEKKKEINQKELDEIINKVAKEIFHSFDDYSNSDKYNKRLNQEECEIDIQPLKSLRMTEVQKSGVMVRKDHYGIARGIADNATMVRVDVFGKGGKNYLVPVYAWQVAQGILPNRAVVANKDEADWDLINDSFIFRFTLYPNDLVKVVTKKEEFFGYYVGLDRATGAITLKEHDTDKRKGKDGIHRSIGVKTVTVFEKYQVDVLGKEIRCCKPEKRPELELKKVKKKS